MTGRGWTDGSDIRMRPLSHIPQQEWDKIFRKAKEIHNELTVDGCAEFAKRDVKNYTGKNPCLKD